MKKNLPAVCVSSVFVSLVSLVFPFMVFAQSSLDGPMPSQGGPTSFTGPYRQDCGGKSSGEAQALSLPAKLEYCSHPVGELRWFSTTVGGLKFLVAVRTVVNSVNAYYELTVREDVSSVDPANDPNNLFVRLKPDASCVCSDYNYDLYVYDGNNPKSLIESSTLSLTSVEELTIPLVNSAQSATAPVTNACDQTSKTIVDAFGGCSSIDSTLYKSVYDACCTVVTKESLLKLLNDALADGVLSKTEKLSLLSALNSYLSAIPASVVTPPTPKVTVQPSGIRLCGAINYDGGCETFTDDDADLRNNSIGNDTVSSIIVPDGATAALYDAINYSGNCETFTANATDFRNEPIGNDTVSSIAVGSACRGGSNGGGDTATESFRASCRSILATDSTIQAECQRIDSSWVSAYYRRAGCSTDIANIDGTLLCASASSGGSGSTCSSNNWTLSLSINSGSDVDIGGYWFSSSGRYALPGDYQYSCRGFGPTGVAHNCSSVTIRSCQTTNVLIRWDP